MPRIAPAIAVLLTACSSGSGGPLAEDVLFVAVEEDGAVAALDGATGELLGTVDLSQQEHGTTVAFEVHNAQTSPDGRTVWVTAMPAGEDGHGAMPEQLIGVDAWSLEVRRRIDLGEDLHAAHVVIAGERAFVTAYEADAVLEVDLATESVARSIWLPAGTSPHGARLTPDAAQVVVAGMGDGSVHVIDIADGTVASYDLPGRAVQTAVLPDGSAAFASVYDTRQIARLDLGTRELTLLDLPAGAAGPVQIYPSPDSTSLWVADQGMVDADDPAGESLYRLDAATGEVELTATVSAGPHGVVVNATGTRVWTTTLVDGTVQAVDAATGAVLATTAVGDKPNGITCAHVGGAMP